MENINEIEEISVIYTICNYCIHKNKPLKTIIKILLLLEINKFSIEDISMLILHIGYSWNKLEKRWEQNVFHEICQDNKEISTDLPDKPVKLDFSLLDSEKELNVSSNDALTLLKNMANMQSTLNKILNHIKNTNKYSF